MSGSRFPPPSSDPRFPRDRSPPKGPERRPQPSYNEGSLASRVAEPAFRSNEPHNTRREPPRAPKALIDGPRGGYVPRLRGGYISRGEGRGRGDTRERDFREGRDDPPFSRRGRGQDWPSRERFDDRPRRISPPGRERSRSPFSRELRESRDGPASAGSSVSDFPVRGRGGHRARGRGNYDFGERGRSNIPEEPEPYKTRSRSRERDWERPARDDREFDAHRRDELSRKEREDKEDRSRREQPPYRPDSRNSGGGPRTPLTSRSTSTTSVQPANYERLPQGHRDLRENVPEYDRRVSGQEIHTTGHNTYKDLEQTNAPFRRTESDRLESRNSSPPLQAPPVPAFGSIPPRAIPPSQGAPARNSLSKDDNPAIHPSRLSLLDPAREAPSAPRAHILSNAPTAPKGRQSLDRDSSDALRTQNTVSDRSKRLDGSHEPDGFYTQPYPPLSDITNSRSESTQPSVRKAVEEQGRNGNVPSTISSRASTGDASSLISSSRIPTGPRADRTGPTSRPPTQPSIRGPVSRGPPINPRGGGGRQPNTLTWTNPNLNRAAPRGPSIMNTVPTKKDYVGEEKYRRSVGSLDSAESHMDPRISPQQRSFASSGTHRRDPPIVADQQESQATSIVDAAKGDHQGREAATAAAGAGSVEEETDEDALEDADMDFDERDFQEAEKKFEREMQSLEARRPLTPRSHPVVLGLLEELDALASALEEKIKDGSADETIKVESAALGLPSPKAEDDGEEKDRNAEGSALLSLRQHPPTPPIENLPFLASGPLTPTSFMGGLEEDESDYEKIKGVLEEKLAAQESDLDIENNEMREQFKSLYKAWRLRVEDIEDAKRAQRVIETSPPPEAGPLTAQSTPAAAGRRGRAHATELDMQKILKESEESAARDEQRRREREDRVYEPPETFNDQREAVVPEMLNHYDMESSIFPNNNNFVPPDQALTAFAFLPKPDDFTKEEHEAFVMEYVQNPKRFGTIARSEKLAVRNYQDCVQHYYSTKLHCSYKTLEANFWKSARGKKVARRRGAANALGFGNDGQVDEGQVLPLTDAGRPRRAAAPNFGATEATDTEQPAAATTPARRGQAGIMNAEKTSAKRPKATGQKPGRKPKAQLLAPQPGPSPAPSPQKNDAPAFRIEPQIMPPEPFKRVDPDLEGAQALAGLNAQPFPVASIRGAETWAQPVMPSVVPARATPEVFHQEPMESTLGYPGAEQSIPINSYWNVAETQDLKNYLAYYGQDWQAIAVNIPAKTHTMVKNRFNKLVKEGDTNLEQIAFRADEKIKRGEPMGPKPAQTPVSSKRRYDMTSRSDPRPLAPLSENAELDRSSPSLRPKTSTQPVPRLGQAPQTLATIAQAEQGAAALSSQMLSQGPANPANRVDLQPRSQNAQQVQGLRLGMLQENRPRASSNTVTSLDAPPERQPPPQHRGLQPQEQQTIDRRNNEIEAQYHQKNQPQQTIDRRNVEVEAQFLQKNQAQQVTIQQQVKREGDPPKLERERQVRHFEPVTFPSSIQLDEASRDLIMRQEQKKQLEREQRDRRELEQQRGQPHVQQYQRQHQSQQQQQQQQQQQHAHQIHQQQGVAIDNTSAARRHPSTFVESYYQHGPSRSPATANLQMPMSPPPHVRPSSVPAPTSAQPPPAPPQPKKKSNIMNLLNDDTEDTRPVRKISDSRPVATPPPQHRQPPQYQLEQSIDQILHRREASSDSLHRSQQSQPQPQQPPLSREPSRDWPSTTLHRQSMYEQIPSFQSPPAPSQPQPPSFMPSTARHSFQSIQRDHAPSPPPSHHSRTSSYTSQHKHRSSVPSAPIEQSLRPSPYANLNPNQPSHPHHNAPQHQHHQIQQQQQAQQQQQQQQQQEALLQNQKHAQQRQRQQEDLRLKHEDLRLREQQDIARLHHQQQQQQPLQGLGEYRSRSTANEDFHARATAARHEQERALMQQDSFRHKLDQQLDLRRAQERAQKDQEAAARHHQNIALRRQQDEDLLLRRQQERDDLRREDPGRGRYTPFYDQQGSGYAPPPPPAQRENPLPPPPPPPPSQLSGVGVQGRGLGGGYEERR